MIAATLFGYVRNIFSTRHQITWILCFSYIYDPVRTGYLDTKRKNLSLLDEQVQRDNVAGHWAREHQRRRSSASSNSVPNSTDSDKAEQSSGIFRPLRRPFDLERQQQQSARTGPDSDSAIVDDCPLREMPTFLSYYRRCSHTFMVYMITKYVILKLMHLEVFGLKREHECYIPGRVTVLPEYSPDLAMLVTFFHAVYRGYLCIGRRSFNLDCFLHLLSDEVTILRKEQRLLELQQRLEQPQAFKEFLENRFFYYRIRLSTRKCTIKFKLNRTIDQAAKVRRFMRTIVGLFAVNFLIWSLPFVFIGIFNGISNAHWTLNYGHCVGHYSFVQQSTVNRSFESIFDGYPSILQTRIPDNRSLSANLNVVFHWNTARCLMFVYDFSETMWLLFDSANGLIWPFSTLCICAQDMTYGIGALAEYVSRLIDKLQRILQTWPETSGGRAEAGEDQHPEHEALLALKLRPEQEACAVLWQHSPTFLAQIEEEILIIQSNLVEVFTQLEQADVYVSKLAAFCMFTWVAANLYYQLYLYLVTGLLVPNNYIVYMQILGVCALTVTFVFLSRTHTKTLRLYNLLCNLVALDPNFQTTKLNWPVVLEYYYHRETSRYSFHLGPKAVLSMANYLKGMSWLITCAFVLINLLSYRLDRLL